MIINVTRVFCLDCDNENRKKPARLGTLRRSGAVSRWSTRDPYRRAAMNRAGWPVSWHVTQVLLGNEGDPQQLKAFCDRHGAGVVDTTAVYHARGKVTLQLKRPRE